MTTVNIDLRGMRHGRQETAAEIVALAAEFESNATVEPEEGRPEGIKMNVADDRVADLRARLRVYPAISIHAASPAQA